MSLPCAWLWTVLLSALGEARGARAGHRGLYVRPGLASSASDPPPPPPSRWQCSPQDGSVSWDGVIVDASVPCDWGITGAAQRAEAMANSSCAGAEVLAAIETGDVNRQNLQVVVVCWKCSPQ